MPLFKRAHTCTYQLKRAHTHTHINLILARLKLLKDQIKQSIAKYFVVFLGFNAHCSKTT